MTLLETVPLPLDRISLNAYRRIDAATINDLRESIKLYGVLQPVLVRYIGVDRYEVVFGNHRVVAARGAGLISIPAIVRRLDDTSALILSVTENAQRFDLDPLDAGAIFDRLSKTMGVEEIASRIGKHTEYVKNRILVFQGLHSDLRDKLGKTLTLSTAIRLSKLPHARQLLVYKQVEEYKDAATHPIDPSRGIPDGRIGGIGTPQKCVCPTCGALHDKMTRIKVG